MQSILKTKAYLTLSHSDSLTATAYENLTAREITLHNIFTCKTK